MKAILKRITSLCLVSAVILSAIITADYSNSSLIDDDSVITVSAATTTYSVKDFGADGSDTEDDTEAFQSALKMAKDETSTVTIKVPSGTYYISSHLRIYSNTYFKLATGAELVRTNDSDYIMIGGGTSTGYTSLENVTIYGGTWDGNVSDTTLANGLLKIENASNITVSNATFENVCGTHFVLFTGVSGLNVTNSTFKDFIHYTGAADDYKKQTDADISYRSAEALHIDYVVKNSSTGETGSPCKDVTVSGCTFSNLTTGVGTHHVYSYMNASNITITNNTFKDCYYYCVNTAGFTDFLMSNNTATNTAGLIFAESTTGTVKNNTITAKSTLSGKMYNYDTFSTSTPTLNVARFSDSTVKFYNNTVKNSSANCVYVCADSTVTVERCTLTGATNAGVGVNDATVKLLDTTIKNSGSNGVTLKEGSTITAKRNYIYGSARNAFYLANKSTGTITDNSMNKNGTNDLSLSDKSTGVVFKNNGSDKRKTNVPSGCSATISGLKKSLRSYSFTISSQRVYTGKQIKPGVTTKLTKNTDFTVTYGTNKSTGEGTVIIKGKGSYSGTYVMRFMIVPKQVKIGTCSKSTTAVRLNWAKSTGASGYQIQRYNSSTGTWSTVKTITSGSTLTYKQTGLSSGTVYKYRIRAYKTVQGVKYYGNWSSTKKLTTKS
ncbi:MAG: right-handed parallel beta-helix repeat-containing protein [Ruminococcus sp.]|nr:right-handed parallel beta-helix repeat-containing protein [Ruminococcus sp.]